MGASPGARYVRPDFEFYGQVSSRVMQLLRNFADRTEQVSIDEAYLEVTERLNLISKNQNLSYDSSIRQLAEEIKKSVMDNQGITCSVGVANCKIVAKIATDMNKPNGLTIVNPEGVLNFLSPLPVSKIPGVGKVTHKILSEKFHIETIEDLQKVPIDVSERCFWKIRYLAL